MAEFDIYTSSNAAVFVHNLGAEGVKLHMVAFNLLIAFVLIYATDLLFK